MERGRDGGQNRPRVDVTADLLDADVVHLFHYSGPSRLERCRDGPSQLGGVGQDVEDEQAGGDRPHEEPDNSRTDAENHSGHVVAVVLDQVADRLDVQVEGRWVDLNGEAVVQPDSDAVDPVGDLADQVHRLTDDQAKEGDEQDQSDNRGADEDYSGSHASFPSPAGQPLDGRCHRESQEEGHQDHHQEVGNTRKDPPSDRSCPENGQRDPDRPWHPHPEPRLLDGGYRFGLPGASRLVAIQRGSSCSFGGPSSWHRTLGIVRNRQPAVCDRCLE